MTTFNTPTILGSVADRLADLPPQDLLALTTGVDYWSTAAIPAAGLRPVRMADGPHGLRLQDDDNPDHLGLNRSKPATCFPPAVTLASSWDPELVEEIGAALGAEARAAGVDVVLGPGLNIKRSPLCGRNFEYYSEDPLVGGTLAGAMTRGLQSRGVAACLKHFALNNQETDRQRVSAEADERTMREIYLRSFEIAITAGTPWTVMSSYNRINGVYASENSWLLTDVLREEWGWDGLVVSDWGAVHEPAQALAAGLDLRMPGRPEDPRLAAALADGSLDVAALRRTATRLAELADRTAHADDVVAPDLEAHHALGRRAAAESAVLLTNDGALPLDASAVRSVAIIGELARTPRFQGAGSSAVNPTRVASALDALRERLDAPADAFAAGYRLDGVPDHALLEDAVRVVQDAEVAILFLGLPGQAEAEGRDRTSIDLPDVQLELLSRLREVGTPVVVALSNGSAVSTAAWRGGVSAIVEFWLTGQAHGEAVADVLLGDAEPAGRLAETIPVALADTPSYVSFPGENGSVHYAEGVFVGHRWYDARDLEVDHAFGHGLSYTDFAYDDLVVDVHDVDDPIAFTASVTLTNSGQRAGAAVPQLYVEHVEPGLRSPLRELRGFEKVRLDAGERTTIRIAVPRDHLQRWHTGVHGWVFSGEALRVVVGRSSRDVALSAEVDVPGTPVRVPLDGYSSLAEWRDDPEAGPALEALLTERGGIRGRMADLLADETGADSVLSVPLVSLIEMPGVPLERSDVDRLLLTASA